MKIAEVSIAILAGGLATRLLPLTKSIPKALIEIQGEPFISHQLRLLQRKGIRRVVVCAGFLGEKISEKIGHGKDLGLHVQFSFDGGSLLGTAGAVRKALPLLSDPFFVLYGDSYLDCSYDTAVRVFQESGKQGLMTVFRNDGRWDTSNVEFRIGQIVAYNKERRTTAMQYIDYGLGVFAKSAFQHVPDDRPTDLEIVYQNLLQQGQLAAYEVFQRFYEIGSPAGLEEFRSFLQLSDQS